MMIITTTMIIMMMMTTTTIITAAMIPPFDGAGFAGVAGGGGIDVDTGVLEVVEEILTKEQGGKR